MDIKLNPELEALLARSADEAGCQPSALLDEIVRQHLLEEWFEREIRPAYERSLRGETKPFDGEAFREHLKRKSVSDNLQAHR